MYEHFVLTYPLQASLTKHLYVIAQFYYFACSLVFLCPIILSSGPSKRHLHNAGQSPVVNNFIIHHGHSHHYLNSDILVPVRVRKYGYGKKSEGYGTGTGEFRKY